MKRAKDTVTQIAALGDSVEDTVCPKVETMAGRTEKRKLSGSELLENKYLLMLCILNPGLCRTWKRRVENEHKKNHKPHYSGW